MLEHEAEDSQDDTRFWDGTTEYAHERFAFCLFDWFVFPFESEKIYYSSYGLHYHENSSSYHYLTVMNH